VKLDGTAPKAAKIDMSQTRLQGANQSENIVADGGKLANVFRLRERRTRRSPFDVLRVGSYQPGGLPFIIRMFWRDDGQNVEIK